MDAKLDLGLKFGILSEVEAFCKGIQTFCLEFPTKKKQAFKYFGSNEMFGLNLTSFSFHGSSQEAGGEGEQALVDEQGGLGRDHQL